MLGIRVILLMVLPFMVVGDVIGNCTVLASGR